MNDKSADFADQSTEPTNRTKSVYLPLDDSMGAEGLEIWDDKDLSNMDMKISDSQKVLRPCKVSSNLATSFKDVMADKTFNNSKEDLF